MSPLLTLTNGCAPTIPFRDFVTLAAHTGFDAISLWPNVWRHARRKEGLGLADLRALLVDHGLALTDVEVCQDWTGPSAATAGSRAERAELFEVCAALGGTTVTALHDTVDGLRFDEDVDAFAALCDSAAEDGLRIALEFVPFSTVRDARTALELVEAADRPNGGLVVDLWHHVRSGAPDEALREIPAARIFSVQLADGPAESPGPDLAEEARTGRIAPGTGGMDLARLLDLLPITGEWPTIGPEVWVPDGPDLEPRIAALRAATLALV